jgi:hypothetical protein
MPTSALQIAPYVIDHMYRLNPASVLDIGAGFGKYGVLFREYCETHPRVEAIEAWEPYVDAHRLRGIYDAVHVTDVMLADDALLNSCAAVYMGDVIEHLTKDDGLALLRRIHRPIVIATPEHFFDNPPDLPWTETHRSHWTIDDFRSTGRVQYEHVVLGGIIVTLGAAA